MLEGRRNACRNVVQKPLEKQSLINPRKVELTVGCEEGSWIQLAEEDVPFRSLACSSSSFSIQLLCVSFGTLPEIVCLLVYNLQWHLTICLPVPTCFQQTAQHRKNWQNKEYSTWKDIDLEIDNLAVTCMGLNQCKFISSLAPSENQYDHDNKYVNFMLFILTMIKK
jgi:hypothetical protein